MLRNHQFHAKTISGATTYPSLLVAMYTLYNIATIAEINTANTVHIKLIEEH